MAKTDRFMIAPITGGLQTDLKAWLITDDAFSTLQNAYVFRGRVRKRFGSYLMNQSVPTNIAQLNSRVRINIGRTDGTGNFAGVAPGNVFDIGQIFSVGSNIFTVYQDGTTMPMLSTGPGSGIYTTGVSGGGVAITGSNTFANVYFYPATPIIGIVTFDDDQLNNEQPIAFDTQFSYQYTSGGWQVLDNVLYGTANPAAIWTGSDSQLMWGYTYRGASSADYYLFVSNFNTPDLLRYYNGSTWNFLSPVLNGPNTLLTARIVVPFKNRLLALNVVELNQGVNIGTTDSSGNFSGTASGSTFAAGQYFLVGTTLFTTNSGSGAVAMTVSAINATGNSSAPVASGTFNTANGAVVITGNGTNTYQPVYYLSNVGGTQEAYVNRCRFSQNGSPIAANAWLDSVADLGDYIDCPVKEQIITAQFLKDRLIVYFESSTWELVFTGNEVQPFTWQQFNTELGCESTFSVVPFDKFTIAIGNVGIHSCNGSNVERIDDKIPDDVFGISNENDGIYRVYGIRDYYAEMVYWSFPAIELDSDYPNRVLVYNYKTGSWAYNNDTITAFGYFQNPNAITWETTGQTWEEYIATWNSPTQNNLFKQIIAGNQEGFIFIVDTETTRNAPALQITNMSKFEDLVIINAINHNLQYVSSVNNPTGGDYVVIENAQGVTGINGNIYPILYVQDANNFIIQEPAFSGTYIGGGTVARVSNINIKTKQYNFYVNQGRNFAINKIDFLVDRTDYGQITVDYLLSSSTQNVLQDALVTGALVGNGVLTTAAYTYSSLEQSQARLWHPIYPMVNGECIQLNLYMNDNANNSQIRNPDIAWADFTLHAMTFYATPTSSRLQ